MQLQTIPVRACGECTVCCKTFAVPEIGKLDSSWCPHCVMGRECSIYDTRPAVCRSFACAWLQGQMGDEFRPDRMGVMIYHQEIQAKNRLVRVMHVYEMRSRALEQPVIAKMIESNEKAGVVIVCRRARDESSYSTSARMDRNLFTQEEAAIIFEQLKGQEISTKRPDQA